MLFVNNQVLYNTIFWLFRGVLEGVGSFGRHAGTISTYPGTYKCQGSIVMAKNSPGGIFVYRPPR